MKILKYIGFGVLILIFAFIGIKSYVDSATEKIVKSAISSKDFAFDENITKEKKDQLHDSLITFHKYMKENPDYEVKGRNNLPLVQLIKSYIADKLITEDEMYDLMFKIRNIEKMDRNDVLAPRSRSKEEKANQTAGQIDKTINDLASNINPPDEELRKEQNKIMENFKQISTAKSYCPEYSGISTTYCFIELMKSYDSPARGFTIGLLNMSQAQLKVMLNEGKSLENEQAKFELSLSVLDAQIVVLNKLKTFQGREIASNSVDALEKEVALSHFTATKVKMIGTADTFANTVQKSIDFNETDKTRLLDVISKKKAIIVSY